MLNKYKPYTEVFLFRKVQGCLLGTKILGGIINNLNIYNKKIRAKIYRGGFKKKIARRTIVAKGYNFLACYCKSKILSVR